MSQSENTSPKTPTIKKLIRWVWLLLFIGIAGSVAFFTALSEGMIWELPSFAELENPKTLLASEIYTSDGELLGKYFSENRTRVRRTQIPNDMINALVATEDERFYEHSGIDFFGLARAVFFLGTKGGGSTLTQQLAKQLYHEPTGSIVQRIKQKLMELVIASKLERSYTKDEILTMYLNKFDFIHNAVGVESAAQVYFNSHVDSLKIHQGALLVGMCKNPALFNPRRFPERATDRRNTVFMQMRKNGFITEAEEDSLNTLPLDLDYKAVSHNEGSATYFREVLRSELAKIFSEKDEDGEYIYHKPDSAHSPYNIYRDGLRVYTTLDSRLQEYAEFAVTEHLSKELQKDFFKDITKLRNPPYSNDLSKEQVDRLVQRAIKRTRRYRILTGRECANCGRRGDYIEEGESESGEDVWYCNADDCHHEEHRYPEDSIQVVLNTPVNTTVFSWSGPKDTVMSPIDSVLYHKSFLHAGLMSMDPHTGEIKAWVGGINQEYFAYDHVRQGRRQVGSTFKPFVYALAIENGLSPCYQVPNIPVTFKAKDYGMMKDWTPNNSDDAYNNEMVSLDFGLANSMNTITAWVMKQYGPEAVIEYARRMGITSPMDTVPSLALGVADISLFEMVGANATFANKGIWQKPIFISRIEDANGNVIAEFIPENREAMNEQNAYVMLELMKGVTRGAKAPDGKRRGTGIRIHFDRPYGNIPWDRPVAGKTGTTQNNSDGWFMGITPDLVTGVWVGAEERAIHFRSTYYGQGANTALPIWGYYMNKVYADESLDISKEDFEKPEYIDVELDCSEESNEGNPYDDNDMGLDGGPDWNR